MSTKSPKKNRTRKSTGRSTATSAKRRKAKKPRVTPSPTYPPACPESCNESRMQERLEEIYLTEKAKFVGRLRANGVRDPEDAFHDAILSVLRPCVGDAVSLQYLPNRLWSRTLNAQATHFRRQNRERFEGEDYWNGIVAEDSSSVRLQSAELVEWLFERLDAKKRQLLTDFHFKGYSIQNISALSGRPVGTIKNALFRARQKAGKLLLELQAQEDSDRNPPPTGKG